MGQQSGVVPGDFVPAESSEDSASFHVQGDDRQGPPGIAPGPVPVMLVPMDWQKPAALSVVALTAAVFLWNRWFKGGRRWGRSNPKLGRGRWAASSGGCGCSAAGSSGTPGLVVQGRRGERPQVIFR